MQFSHWYFLLAMPVILFLMIERKKEALPFSNIELLKQTGSEKMWKHKIGKYLINLALCFFVIAMARPQIPSNILPNFGEGIDIAMVLDVSESMQSVDFSPNRLEVARDTIESFIKKRAEDRIGLVVFAGTAYTRVPLTLDHQAVLQSLEGVQTESVSEDGTAIGMALSVGINRLKKSEANTKIIVLVTDGDNNAGAIDPETASKLAAESGIKIYTVGVGTDKTIYPVSFMGQTTYKTMNSGLNEALLQKIAQVSDGVYYRALDEKGLETVFDAINQLEKTEFERDAFQQYDEFAFPFIKIGLVLLLIGIVLDRYIFVQIP